MEQEYTSPWIRIHPGNWSDLVPNRMPVLFKRNTMLYQAGELSETIYIVESGRVRITTYQSSGAEKQLYIAEQGSLFGESSCFTHGSYDATAVAIVDSMVYCIPWEEAREAMRANWSLTEQVIQVICRKKAILQKQVLELSFADAMQRIAQMLLNLAGEYGQRQPDDSIRISIRFTHQDVANLTNTSRVTVSNVFQILIGRDMLSKKDGNFHLKNTELLRELAGGASLDA